MRLSIHLDINLTRRDDDEPERDTPDDPRPHFGHHIGFQPQEDQP